MGCARLGPGGEAVTDKLMFEVEFVYLDEAPPRTLHTMQVDAPDAEEAKLAAWVTMQLGGDRISVSDVIEIGAAS